MRTTTGTYDTENALLQKKPVVIVEISNMTNRYVNQTFADIVGTDKKYLKSFVANFPKIDLLDQPFPLKGKFSFSIEDIDLDVTSDLNSNPIVDDAVTLKYGYQGLAEANFVTLKPTQVFENPVLGGDLQTYNFVSSDVRRLLRGNIGRRSTGDWLDAAINEVVGTISVDDISQFIDPANLPTHFDNDSGTGPNDKAYINIDNEIIGYRTVNGGANDFESCTRDICGTTGFDGSEGAHADGKTVKQVFCFQNLYPTEALLQILLTTDDGSGHAFYDMASFDSGYEGMGFEFDLTASHVDIEGIERLGWKYFHNAFENCGQLVLHQEEDGVAWIVKNILRPAGLYMYIDSTSGLISVKSIDRLDFIEDFTSDDDLTKSDIVNINNYEIDQKNTLNNINYRNLINPITGNVFGSSVYTLTDSVTEYGLREKPYVIESPLFNLTDSMSKYVGTGDAATEGQWVMKVVVRRWFYTFGNPLGILNFNVSPDNWKLEPTDKITITHDLIPDPNDGTRGWSSKKLFITGQTISPLTLPPVFNYTAITWEAYSKLSSFYTFTTIESGSIDDTTVTFSATNDETTEAADGYVDPADAPHSPDIVIFTVTITPPGNGTTMHWIKLGFKAIFEPQGTGGSSEIIIHDQNYRAIRYLSSDSTPFDLDFVIIGTRNGGAPGNGFQITHRYKIDWYAASSDGLEGGGTERPTVTFKEFKFSDFGEAMAFDRVLTSN